MYRVIAGMAIGVILALASSTYPRDLGKQRTLTTIADARRGMKNPVDLGQPGDSQGDLFVFDQPLLDAAGKEIGTNGGFCIRTKPGEYSECQWTLTFADGTINVSGREAEKGTSFVALAGGTGAYLGARGEMATTPNSDGTFTQVVKILG
jgi:hypothetical protein